MKSMNSCSIGRFRRRGGLQNIEPKKRRKNPCGYTVLSLSEGPWREDKGGIIAILSSLKGVNAQEVHAKPPKKQNNPPTPPPPNQKKHPKKSQGGEVLVQSGTHLRDAPIGEERNKRREGRYVENSVSRNLFRSVPLGKNGLGGGGFV